jgi:hypothetical protein
MILKFKNNYQASEESLPNPPLDLFIGTVSADTLIDPINVCSILELSEVVYIKQQYIGYITSGDLVFYDHEETLPFLGNDEYYKIKASNSQIHAATITSGGMIINNYAICVS